MDDFFYKVNGIEYPVHIIYKKIKNMYFRFIDGAFVITCNKKVSKKTIISGLDKYGSKIIQRNKKVNASGEDFLYLLGVKVDVHESGEIAFSDGSKIVYKNKEELNKKLKKFFKDLMIKRTKYYTSLMKLPEYKVSVKEMRSRFGSNSKYTKTIHYAYVLMHFSIEIIDSVIVHELAHILVYDHSKKFYDIVYKYCPNYDIYRKKLIRSEFK